VSRNLTSDPETGPRRRSNEVKRVLEAACLLMVTWSRQAQCRLQTSRIGRKRIDTRFWCTATPETSAPENSDPTIVPTSSDQESSNDYVWDYGLP
jgi:hypothetical protein